MGTGVKDVNPGWTMTLNLETRLALQTVIRVLNASSVPNPFKSAVGAIPNLALTIMGTAESAKRNKNEADELAEYIARLSVITTHELLKRGVPGDNSDALQGVEEFTRVINRVLVKIKKLQSWTSGGRWFDYRNDMLDIDGFKENIRNAMNLLQLEELLTVQLTLETVKENGGHTPLGVTTVADTVEGAKTAIVTAVETRSETVNVVGAGIDAAKSTSQTIAVEVGTTGAAIQTMGGDVDAVAKDHVEGSEADDQSPPAHVVSKGLVRVNPERKSTQENFVLQSPNPQNAIFKQLVHRGPFCLPSSVADLQFTDSRLLLQELNQVFRTRHTFESTPSLDLVLDNSISRGYDFGTTYGMLRPWWTNGSNFPSLLSTFETLERNDLEARKQAVADGMVTNPMMPPRRVWDLFSNRVLPIWVVETDLDVQPDGYERIMPLFAISHAWMFPAQRRDITTRVNGDKWPVPLPVDGNLDDVRIELLNMGAEYAWLDILCLRQKGGEPAQETLRPREWELDVPTIGAVYTKCQHTVVYLNGLGRPFEQTDLHSARHWCNRAWTLQEWCFASSISVAGVTSQSPKFRFDVPVRAIAEGPDDGYPRLLKTRMDSGSATARYIFQAAAEMRRRSAESDRDKIAGLAFNFSANWQHPAFYEERSVEDAWSRFVLCMSPRVRGDLFFLFPVQGDGKLKWLPSWHQLLDDAQRLASNSMTATAELDSDSDFNPSVGKEGEYTCRVIFLPSCTLSGFDQTSMAGGNPREGTITFETDRIVTLQ
ncbi:hypothetical protein FRB96_003797 [Tulasnella sp. 330]|nr:hypothetical protein FRB96_003797 [Tulasnella sp. 330]